MSATTPTGWAITVHAGVHSEGLAPEARKPLPGNDSISVVVHISQPHPWLRFVGLDRTDEFDIDEAQALHGLLGEAIGICRGVIDGSIY